MRALVILFLAFEVCFAGCSNSTKNDESSPEIINTDTIESDSFQRKKIGFVVHPNSPKVKAILASRFTSLEQFNKVVKIEYYKGWRKVDTASIHNNAVELTYTSNGNDLICRLKAGLSQDDITKALEGGFNERMNLLTISPFAVRNRAELNKISRLARRRPALFGEGDVAFFDLAETSVFNINTPDLAFYSPKDSSEKGFLNTFNHITAQTFISTFHSIYMAEFVGDVHERHNMPELTTGMFSKEQLTDLDNNPIDNYVDVINNRIGQDLGYYLKSKYGITSETNWTNELLCDYLNDIQSYYCWSFGIGMKPYKPEDELIKRFADKINVVAKGVPFQDI